ncbi:hypothetical protein EVAR_20143_1 [Eumeta japonica]|uniref:Uncharacterized protein n=1 Tax=Eumeta variegata TaxID=151549 RepID=A0A4C1V2D1_EUMVA|nr:hypothetical protein EVAR_20143_1 [Eumeta japonica]
MRKRTSARIRVRTCPYRTRSLLDRGVKRAIPLQSNKNAPRVPVHEYHDLTNCLLSSEQHSYNERPEPTARRSRRRMRLRDTEMSMKYSTLFREISEYSPRRRHAKADL